MKLTKSLFTEAQENPLHAWVHVNKPDAYHEADSPSRTFNIEQGHNIESLAHAHSRFQVEYEHEPLEPVEIKAHHEAGMAETFAVMKAGHKVIYQATAVSGTLSCRGDILVFNDITDSWDLYEVKSSAVDEVKLLDVGFQRITYELAGIPVGRVHIMHPNKEYVLEGELDPEQFFTITDVTDVLIEGNSSTRRAIRNTLRDIQAETPDKLKPCYKPDDCPCSGECHPDLPKSSIYNIPRIGDEKKEYYRSNGVVDIQDIDLAEERANLREKPKQRRIGLTARQIDHVAVVQSGQTKFKAHEVYNMLTPMSPENPTGITYPVHFLDFETINPVIPLRQGDHPSSFITFQVSNHTALNPSDTLQAVEEFHDGYIAKNTEETLLPFAQKLRAMLGETGTICIWNKSFEPPRIRELAEKIRHLDAELADYLMSLLPRFVDLMEIVTKGYFVHPAFNMSASIKDVLPVLAPELTYKLLGIREGTAASVAWYRAYFEEGVTPEERKKILDDLWDYCKMDTYAMVRIFFVLREMAFDKLATTGALQSKLPFSQ